MAVYGKQMHFTKDSQVHNIQLVTSSSEASPLTLNYSDNNGITYASMVYPSHRLSSPLRVVNGSTYAVPYRYVYPYTYVVYTYGSTFTVPAEITRVRITLVGGGGGAYVSQYAGSAGGGGTTTIRGFGLWTWVGGGGGAYVSYYTVGEGEYATTYTTGGPGGGGSPSGRGGGSYTGGAGWTLANGGVYGKGADAGVWSSYSGSGWSRVYYYGGSGGGGGYTQFTVNVHSGMVYNFSVGGGASGATSGAVQFEYGEGIEP